MNKRILFSVFVITLFTSYVFAQSRALPNINVKSLEGNNINITEIENEGKPIIISFWATWCKPCVEEMPSLDSLLTHKDLNNLKIFPINAHIGQRIIAIK